MTTYKLDLETAFKGKTLDVTGLGAAIVDILARVDEAFLTHHDITKHAMTLIDSPRAEAIHAMMMDERTESPPHMSAGGSAANTIAGLAKLGAKTAFAGKTKNDTMGLLFRRGMGQLGVSFDTEPAADDADGATARSMILITPDAHRSMCTDLGVSGQLFVEDVPEAKIAASKVVYLEGYLWDTDENKRAFAYAMKTAKDVHSLVALTLSDTFCVERHRDSFRQIVGGDVDILFANELEILALYETTDIDEAVKRAAADCAIAVITRSEKGCIIASGDRRFDQPAEPIAKLLDTTGAGDQFAAGFLYGLVHKRHLELCGRMGCVAAAEVIQHIGPRPEHDMHAMFERAGIPL